MTINIKGININYFVMGEGSPLIFVHGWGGSANSLLSLAQIASKKNQVIVLDLPGFGKSDMPGINWGVDEYATLLIDFIMSLNLKTVNYFGHSFGGSLGIYLAAKYPKIINKLILCDASFKREVIEKTKKQKILKKIGDMLPLIKKLYYQTFLRHTDLARFPKLESNLRIIVQQDLTPLLVEIKQKTLILWGQDDQVTPITLALELHKKIKNSLFFAFPKIGHALPIKHPEIVYQKVEDFI